MTQLYILFLISFCNHYTVGLITLAVPVFYVL